MFSTHAISQHTMSESDQLFVVFSDVESRHIVLQLLSNFLY